MNRLEKISVFLLILYYLAHIYAVHIHLFPEKSRDLNPASFYSAKSNGVDLLCQKLHYRHLSSQRHVNFGGYGKLTSETNYKTKNDEPSSVILIQHATTYSNVLPFLSLINKAPPIYLS